MRHQLGDNCPSYSSVSRVHIWLACAIAALVVALAPQPAVAQAGAPWLQFTGPGQGHIEVPDNPALNPTSAITVETWVYLQNTYSWGGDSCPGLVGKGFEEAYWLCICGDHPRFYPSGSGSYEDATGTVPVGVWTHLAATYDGTTVRFYINGTLDSAFAGSSGPPTTSTKPLMIGSDPDYDYSPIGFMDEVRIWNVARSQSEILSTMNTPITSARSGLVAVWGMGGAANATVGGFHGTLVGDVSFTSSVTPTPTSCPFAYFVPTSGHLPGAGGTQWRTSISILNTQPTDAGFAVFLLRRDTDNSNPAFISATAYSFLPVWGDDIIPDWFGESTLAAALKVCSDGPLLVSSRTYNLSGSGTYGQGVPGFPSSRAVADGQATYLTGLEEDANARTNLGFVNTTMSTISVTVDYYEPNGNLFGSQTYPVPPQGYIQRTHAYREVTASDVLGGFVRVTASGGAIFAYASITDGHTGDPAYYNAE